MFLQAAGCGETGGALATLKRHLSRVDPCVPRRVRAGGEGGRALAAGKRAWVAGAVLSLDVALQTAGLGENRTALATPERLLPSVHFLVPL